MSQKFSIPWVDDFPYYETHGFPEDFVLLENILCAFYLEGQLMRDDIGNPVIECMCGRFDPRSPFLPRAAPNSISC